MNLKKELDYHVEISARLRVDVEDLTRMLREKEMLAEFYRNSSSVCGFPILAQFLKISAFCTSRELRNKTLRGPTARTVRLWVLFWVCEVKCW